MDFAHRNTALESSSPGLIEFLENEHKRSKRSLLELCERGKNQTQAQTQRRKRCHSLFFNWSVTKNIKRHHHHHHHHHQGGQWFSPSQSIALLGGRKGTLDRGLESVSWRKQLSPGLGSELSAMGVSSTLPSSSRECGSQHGQDQQGQEQEQGQGHDQGKAECQGHDEGKGQCQGHDEGKGQGLGHTGHTEQGQEKGQGHGHTGHTGQEKEQGHGPGASSLQCVPIRKALGIITPCTTDGVPMWKKLLTKAQARDKTIINIEGKIQSEEYLLKAFQETRAALEKFTIKDKPSEETEKEEEKEKEKEKEKEEAVAFTPLTKEEEETVSQALNGSNRHEVLVQHERSNIDLTSRAIQCLRPGAWLNDDVINLYLELLKERELREPKSFMKCHFFNTFFYNKLYKDAHSYNYKAVRRWTTTNKLGYSLLQCDKIFVPIHKDVHWCLAVINLREKKIQYLDSLKGRDANVLHVLARYLKDEAKDKLNEDLDSNSWELDCPTDIPEQLNGCDCGMFMIKYADFYSRGNELKFSQRNMGYFRRRTTLELLELKAR